VIDLNLLHILVSVAGSGVGYVYLSWGRSEANWTLVASGLGLMTYSYFVTSLFWLVVVGGVISAVPYLHRLNS
jgi:hypothetical protein